MGIRNKLLLSRETKQLLVVIVVVALMGLQLNAFLKLHSYDSIMNAAPVEQQQKDGWKEIHVFFGNKSHSEKGGEGSQVGQDTLIAALFQGKQRGFFLDLAANHATIISNTYHLEEKYDWDGICIEPNSVYWRGLSYRNCIHVAAVVGKDRMEEVTYSVPGKGTRNAAGGIKSNSFDRKADAGGTVDIKFFTVPLVEILQKFNAPTIIDYFSLDVEGAEYFIMKDFPFQQFKFKTATIERPNQELVDLLYSQGYEYIAGNNKWGDETVWIHKDFKEHLDVASAISNADYINGSTLRYPRPYPGAKPVVNLKYTGTINGTVYEIGSNAGR